MKLKKISAVLGVASLALAGALATPAAFGADVTGTAETEITAANIAPGNVDTTKKGSITLYKYANPGLANNADPAGPAEGEFDSLTPIKGVVFSYQKINVDLTTAAGWEALKGIDPAAVPEDKLEGDAVEMPATDAAGKTTAANLAVGAYLVTETGYDAAAPSVETAADPFIITIPYVSEAGKWIYDVNAYPKNDIKKGTPQKAVKNESAKVGADITWNFSLPVSPLAQGQTKYTAFGAYEVLADNLTYKSVENAKFIPATGGEGTPITVECSATELDLDAVAGYANTTYKCAVAEASLAALRGGGTVVFDVVTTLTSAPTDASGEVNQGYYPLTPDKDPFADTDGDGDPDVPEKPEPPVDPETTQYMGKLEFTKVDKADTALALKGAVFTLNQLGTDGTCTTPGTQLYEVTSGADGKVAFDSVFVKKDTPNITGDALTKLTKDYCLVEKTAPAGYKKVANTKVTITAGATATAGGITDGKFVNEIDTSLVPGLPLTGGAGTIALTLGGLAVLAGGVAFALKSARRNQTA